MRDLQVFLLGVLVGTGLAFLVVVWGVSYPKTAEAPFPVHNPRNGEPWNVGGELVKAYHCVLVGNPKRYVCALPADVEMPAEAKQ